MLSLSRFKPGNRHTDGTLSLLSTAQQLAHKLADLKFDPTYIAGFVSPHVNLDEVARQISQRFPHTVISLCTTSGELSSENQRLYCNTGAQWDRVVLQLFDASVIAEAEIVQVPLECEDIRNGAQRMSMAQRIAKLTASIKRLQVSMKIDYRDTLANIFFDGLSASESFFMEALYESGRFPCLFVGGSAGGKLDFQKTQLHDGKRSYQNHALIVFLKCARDVRFGVFKSQNFEPTALSLSVLSASLAGMYPCEAEPGRASDCASRVAFRLMASRIVPMVSASKRFSTMQAPSRLIRATAAAATSAAATSGEPASTRSSAGAGAGASTAVTITRWPSSRAALRPLPLRAL